MDSIGVIRELQAIRQAEADVASRVGTLPAMDSAGAIYRAALKQLGHDVAPFGTMTSTGWRTVWRMSQRPGIRPGNLRVGMDAKAASGFADRFPNAVPLRTLG